jgi:DNA-binding transcriptional regulator YiaG
MMKYPEKQRRRAEMLRELGWPHKKIARYLRVSDTTIRRWLVPGYIERHRADCRNAKRRRTGTCIECGATTTLQRFGGKPAERCFPCSTRAARRYDHDRIIELRQEGLSQPKIAELVGCTQSHVADILGRNGMHVGRGSGPGRGAKLS